MLYALCDASEGSHTVATALIRRFRETWVVPAAAIPEVDHLVERRLGARAQDQLLRDLTLGRFQVEWGRSEDLIAAHEITQQYASLGLGYVDAMVMATAVRLKAEAIATLDLRHFGAVSLPTRPRLLPRDAAL